MFLFERPLFFFLFHIKTNFLPHFSARDTQGNTNNISRTITVKGTSFVEIRQHFQVSRVTSDFPVSVSDVTPPNISLNGPDVVVLNVSDAFQDPGVDYSDEFGPVNVTVSVFHVDYHVGYSHFFIIKTPVLFFLFLRTARQQLEHQRSWKISAQLHQ